jgi:phosphoribosyl 1,2-cyclic phosphodiesterase
MSWSISKIFQDPPLTSFVDCVSLAGPTAPWYTHPAYVALAGVGVILVIMIFTICVMAWYLRISSSDKPDFHRGGKNDREKIISNRPRKQIGFVFDNDTQNKMDDEAIMY